MAGNNLSPRQKMIGMMYLVLLALLAMNVSKEIIMAFVMLNNKMDKSISQVEKGNNAIEADFQNALSTLNAAQKPNPKEIARVEALIQKNSDARGLIKTAAKKDSSLNYQVSEAGFLYAYVKKISENAIT